MDEVFKALADPTRRSLLDELFERDGQSLSELEQRLPMSRFGVMKHLKLLEEAGLVTTRRRGREKLHFLNPVPIRLVYERWVSKYSESWAAGLSRAQTRHRGGAVMNSERDVGSGGRAGDGRLRDLHQDDAGAALGGDRRPRAEEEVQLRGRRRVGLDARLGVPLRGRGGFEIAAGENLEVEPPTPARPELPGALERGREGGRALPGDLGDRAGRRGLLPAPGHPRPAARGRQQRTLRRLADDPLRPEDAAGDRRAADHPGLAALLGGRRGCERRDASRIDAR